MQAIKGKKTFEVSRSELEKRIKGFEAVVVDIGTGDGKFVYRLAQAHPQWFCIGIDPVRTSLRDYSTRIYRKPSRGGLAQANALYIIASVENLPPELNGLADRVYINFPWGSLLEAVVRADRKVLANLVRIVSAGGSIEVRINYSIFSEPVPIEVKELPELTTDYLDHELAPAYAQAGISILDRRLVGKEELNEIATTWSKRLAYGREPGTVYVKMGVMKGSHGR